MRTALCLCGIVGGRTGKDGKGGPIDFQKCYESYKQHIIDVNHADVFIHSWSVDFEKELSELYRPKKSVFETQIYFPGHTLLNRKERHDEFIVKSKWYSAQEVMKLKTAYEQEMGFAYDQVMLSRFDLLWFVDFPFAKVGAGFCAPNFNDLPVGKAPTSRENRTLKEPRYLDLWFVGTSAHMNALCSLYQKIDEYIGPDVHKHTGAPKLIDPHRYVWSHVKNTIGEPLRVTTFMYYRWVDFELIRLKHG